MGGDLVPPADPKGTYLVPLGDGSGELILDISGIGKAKARLEDVANVNAYNASELLHVFAQAHGRIAKAIVRVASEQRKAAKALAETKADAMLAADAALRDERGIARPTKELREAYVTLHPSVRGVCDRMEHLEVTLGYLRASLDEFAKGYQSVKKLLEARQVPGSAGVTIPHLAAGEMPEGFGEPGRY